MSTRLEQLAEIRALIQTAREINYIIEELGTTQQHRREEADKVLRKADSKVFYLFNALINSGGEV